MKTLEKVHVIPLGFERSVVVKPIRVLGCSRAHIITIGGEYAQKYELYEKQRYFEKTVRKDLEEMGIEVNVHYTDLFDFKMAVANLSRIIVEEKNRGSDVYVNISSHGRFLSVVSALVGWYHNARVYYVFPDRYAKDEEEEKLYGRSICENVRVFELPNVEFVKLSEEERFALSVVYSKIQKNGREFVWLKDIKDKFSEKFPHIYSFEKNEWKRKRERDQKLITKINRRVLDKLESKGYIKRDKIGRNTTLKLTESGEFLALLEANLPDFE